MERKTKMKIGYFIKENKMETSTLHQHGILTQNSEKTSKHKSHRTEQEKEQNSTPQISTDTRRFDSKNCLRIGQLAVHRSQLGFELLDFTVQTTDCSKHSLFLGTLVQKEIIASKISDISFQVSDFNFQIGTLMFESHALEQRLLVLFTVLSSPKPPVINCQQSTTCIKETARNHYKIP
jgi:hypothetical protein